MSQNLNSQGSGNNNGWIKWVVIAAVVIYLWNSAGSSLNSLSMFSLASSNANQANSLSSQADSLSSLTGNVSSISAGINALLSGQKDGLNQLGQINGKMDGLSQMTQSILGQVNGLTGAVGQIQGMQQSMQTTIGHLDTRLTTVEDKMSNPQAPLQPQLQQQAAPTIATPIPQTVLKPGQRMVLVIDPSGKKGVVILNQDGTVDPR